MRDLTDAEKDIIYLHCKCIFCDSEEFYEGPHGGMQINWFCAACLAGYNLSPPALRYAQLIRLPRGQQAQQTVVSPWYNAMSEFDLKTIFKRKTTLRAWFEMMKSTPWGEDEGSSTRH